MNQSSDLARIWYLISKDGKVLSLVRAGWGAEERISNTIKTKLKKINLVKINYKIKKSIQYCYDLIAS